MSIFKKAHFNQLTSSRFFAFLLIFFAHCFVTGSEQIENAGWFIQLKEYSKLGVIGVDYFFVFSSFLITWIGLEEREHKQSFNLKNFFIRRTLRIWPLYFLIVGFGFALFSIAQLNDIEINNLPSALYFITLTLNLYIAEYGSGFVIFMVFLWSISLEEQFYVFWGFCLRFLHKQLH